MCTIEVAFIPLNPFQILENVNLQRLSDIYLTLMKNNERIVPQGCYPLFTGKRGEFIITRADDANAQQNCDNTFEMKQEGNVRCEKK